MNKLEECLAKLIDMEWKFQYYSNGPDEFQCPNFCSRAIQGNIKSPKDCYHDDGCEYKFVMDHLKYLISKENPHDALKEIL